MAMWKDGWESMEESYACPAPGKQASGDSEESVWPYQEAIHDEADILKIHT